ncbi:YhgE/Pip domain-containing protein [Clostridium sp. YIM B02515]|uniref:YhgE/Pip domain-containing protein n=1 Tax=Clostridium rhizosphaerae TaxID=2803861 RepID=A0ABS1TFP8_9CLOT|nr:YhgE/Pip domain-containing protein [Clostridium rhizosphaerae]MBL4938199.1 YhgE/Pip domain-containing protein [Clostridium rhizosphaerae]
MKSILKIYKRDLKNVIKNPVALIIIIGVCVIPSLYAWVNIKACWDPYEKTNNIPIAVVNKDKGTSFKEKDINVGNEVVENLKKNHNIGWKFVGDKEAELGVMDGTYYAVIEIPEDFSARFTSILTDNAKKPRINYKVDTKSNPIATKITGSAKSALVGQITSSFIATVNETAFSKLNEVGENAEKNKQNLINLKDNIIQIDKNMDAITSVLENINGNSKNLNTLLLELKTTMPSVSGGINTLQQNNQSKKDLINSTQKTLNASLDNIQLSLNSAEASVNKTHDLIQSLNNGIAATNSSAVNSTIYTINAQIDAMINGITPIIKYLETLNAASPNAETANLIASLKCTQTSLNDAKDKGTNLQQQFNKSNELNKNLLNSLNDSILKANTNLINSSKQYNSSTKASLNKIFNSLITATNDASDLLKSASGMSSQIDNIINTSIEGTNVSYKVSGDLNRRLYQFKDIISQLSDKFQQVNNNDLIQIITILQSNPQFMGNFISSPFELREESIYGIPNYGSAMSPVYTVLALWVGCLILTSILKTEVSYFDGIENISLREQHFGKMLTFITLAVIQAFIVSVGDKLLLGVYSQYTVLMIIFAMVSSFTFSIITFTMVSILGNFGKALNIVYMIIQLAGSGGTYPIQVDPLIFRILQPLFPFTYSIGGFREAVAGPIISKVVWDFAALILFAAVFILVGYYFKEPLHKLVHRFETKFKESGIGE